GPTRACAGSALHPVGRTSRSVDAGTVLAPEAWTVTATVPDSPTSSVAGAAISKRSSAVARYLCPLWAVKLTVSPCPFGLTRFPVVASTRRYGPLKSGLRRVTSPVRPAVTAISFAAPPDHATSTVRSPRARSPETEPSGQTLGRA